MLNEKSMKINEITRLIEVKKQEVNKANAQCAAYATQEKLREELRTLEAQRRAIFNS